MFLSRKLKGAEKSTLVRLFPRAGVGGVPFLAQEAKLIVSIRVMHL